jgi:hypothetical protein
MEEQFQAIAQFFSNLYRRIRSIPYGFWIMGLVIPFASYQAYRYRWVCDDAFISFRYARNFIRGLGLIYNEGEIVEGYTNFLWTLGIALGMKLDIDPLRWVQGLGILSYIGSILVVYFFGLKNYLQYKSFQHTASAQLSSEKESELNLSLYEKGYLPLGAILLGLQTHAQIYATGGLETSFFGFLIICGYSLIIYSKKLGNIVFGQFLLTLSAMTRPEGLLFLTFGLLYVIFFHRRKFSAFQAKVRIIFSFIPFLLVYVPYWVWRLTYYERFFPNTYYAKYGQGNNIRQGIEYILLYLNAYYVFYIGIFLTIILLWKRAKSTNLFKGLVSKKVYRGMEIPSRKLSEKTHREVIYKEVPLLQKKKFLFGPIGEIFFLTCIPSIIYVLYLIKIGGDFMFARLLISLSPIFFLWIEITWLTGVQQNLKKVIPAVLIISLLLYNNPYTGTKIPVIKNISSENDIYKLKDVYKIKSTLVPLSDLFRELKIKIAFGGAQAIFAYYLDAPVAIETASGLTDRFIANLPNSRKGKIGHEKKVPPKYLRRRGVHILFDSSIYYKTDYNQIFIKGIPYAFTIVKYDSKIFQKLYDSNKFSFMKFESYLDQYFANSHKIPLARQKKDFKKFQQYYFHWNDDKTREQFFYGNILEEGAKE